jgi:hypothetical protein
LIPDWLLEFAARSASRTEIRLERVQGGAESLPIESSADDSIVPLDQDTAK